MVTLLVFILGKLVLRGFPGIQKRLNFRCPSLGRAPVVSGELLGAMEGSGSGREKARCHQGA